MAYFWKFSEEEIALICSAIFNHSDKDIIHEMFDEILKDADVMQHILYNPLFEIKKHEQERFHNLTKEFEMIE